MSSTAPGGAGVAEASSGVAMDARHCRLLGPVGIATQVLMGVVVLATLLYKRHRERPRRAWRTWALDVSKQLTGQGMVHMLNVMFSAVSLSYAHHNPCSLYFLNILLDSTLGLFVLYGVLHGATRVLEDVWELQGFVSGEYHPAGAPGRAPPSVLQCWLRQTGVYLLGLVAMKALVLVVLAWLPFLVAFGSWLLGLFGTHRAMQVVFVMALFPMAMNMLQFWLIDSMLLYRPRSMDAYMPVPLPTVQPLAPSAEAEAPAEERRS
ncbi:hypothetical protein MCAP1_000991 [Malassezia caprae]|uniref:Vacuolar membrane protein n=1 Tax=Malassezia caprae TaxID=1381934 RepID=A0AAF0E539_9BASI|nr:hypothetical protein MCAP1_000991 [Malassezia caprae]